MSLLETTRSSQELATILSAIPVISVLLWKERLAVRAGCTTNCRNSMGGQPSQGLSAAAAGSRHRGGRLRVQAIGSRRHNEVVAVQAFNLMGPPGDLHPPP